MAGSFGNAEKCALPSPFFESWYNSRVVETDTISTTSELFSDYSMYVSKQTTVASVLSLVKLRRFGMALTARYPRVKTSKGRYQLQLLAKRQHRVTTIPVSKAYSDYICIPIAERSINIERIHVSKCVGYGAIASKDINKDQVICEYIGKVIPREVATIREQEYGKIEYPPAMFNLPDRTCLDPYWQDDGTIIAAPPPWVLLNHSRLQPNCKTVPVYTEGRYHVLIVAITGIPQGMQFLYDYGEQGKDTPRWMKDS